MCAAAAERCNKVVQRVQTMRERCEDDSRPIVQSHNFHSPHHRLPLSLLTVSVVRRHLLPELYAPFARKFHLDPHFGPSSNSRVAVVLQLTQFGC